MKKIFLFSLLAYSLLGSTLTIARERLSEETPKEERAKDSWIKTKSIQAYQKVKATPGWVWWTGGGILVLGAISALGIYSYQEGVLEGFLDSNYKKKKPKLPYVIPERTYAISPSVVPEMPDQDSPKTSSIKAIRADLDKVKEAVIDLETETYGTTFLREEKVVVDGTDIYVVGN